MLENNKAVVAGENRVNCRLAALPKPEADGTQLLMFLDNAVDKIKKTGITRH